MKIHVRPARYSPTAFSFNDKWKVNSWKNDWVIIGFKKQDCLEEDHGFKQDCKQQKEKTYAGKKWNQCTGSGKEQKRWVGKGIPAFCCME